jgi:hypothetical protein
MDAITVIIMIVLFLFLLVFVFSTALLTPLIGKKNLLFVVVLGFVVGIIGGAFLIAPISNDIPDMARSVYQYTSGSSAEIIDVDVSTNVNITTFMENTKQIEGVKSVQSSGITIKTDTIPEDWKGTFKVRIPTAVPNVTSVQIQGSDTIILNIKNNSNPQEVIQKLKDWMMLVSGINVKYSIVHISIYVDASQVDTVVNKLPKDQLAIISVGGPLEEKIADLKSMIPSQSNIVLFCGFLGIIAGLAGLFVDSILSVLARIRDAILKRGREKE